MRSALAAALLLAALPAPAQSGSVRLLHFSDYHSHAVPFRSEGLPGQGGIQRGRCKRADRRSIVPLGRPLPLHQLGNIDQDCRLDLVFRQTELAGGGMSAPGNQQAGDDEAAKIHSVKSQRRLICRRSCGSASCVKPNGVGSK